MVKPPTALALAVLGVYMILAVPTLFTAVCHGLNYPAAVLGWGWLFVFCTLKIVANAIYLGYPSSSSSFVAMSIIGSVVLSPLILALIGLLREVRRYGFPVKSYEAIVILVAEMHVGVAIVLVAMGASDIARGSAAFSDSDGPGSWLGPDDDDDGDDAARIVDVARTDSGYLKALVGTAILVAVFMGAAAAAVLTLARWPRARGAGAAPAAARTLVVGVVATLPFLGTRVLTSLVFFARRDATLNPVGGDVDKTVALEVWQEIMVAVILVMTGLLTRDLSRGAVGAPVSGGSG